MLRILSILVLFTVILIGCPNGEPIDPGPIPTPTPDPVPVPDDVVIQPQKCKVEWYGVSFDNYDDLLDQLQMVLGFSNCTADDLLCIYIETEDECNKVWVFPNMDSIPRHTLKDPCGNIVIHYKEDDL